MKPLRVLVVGWTATTGGIEHFLMAYCGKMNRERVQFDFLCRFSPIACQKEAEKIGKIYTITRRSSDIMRYYREINDFFREHGHEYDIIWDNECMFNDMTPLKKALEHEKTPELAAKLAEEAVERDSWAAEVSQLAVPKLVEQVALNAWKEQEGSRVCLHLRPSQRHLNSASAQQKLAEALGVLYGTPVELTIVEDDNPAMRTPLEWRQAIYEEKLAQAREAIIADNNIQTLRRFFDADLDEESIRPI